MQVFNRPRVRRYRLHSGKGWIGGSLPPDPNPNSPDGRTRVLGEPAPMEVRLLDGKTRKCIDSQRSKPDGTWRFGGLSRDRYYAVEFVNQNGVYVDNNGVPYNSFIQDFIYPMPPEFENVGIITAHSGSSFTASLYPPDAYLEYVSSLSRFDNTFVDFFDFEWEPSGSPAFTGEAFDIFDSTLFLNGANQYIYTPDRENFQFADSDFCIEAHVNPASRGTNFGCWIISKDLSSNQNARDWRFYIDPDGLLGFSVVTDDDVDQFLTSVSSVPLDEWSHVAVCRDGNFVRLFINGITEAALDIGSKSLRQTSNRVCIGTNSNPQTGTYFHGSIAQIRITKAARYTSDFDSENIPFTLE